MPQSVRRFAGLVVAEQGNVLRPNCAEGHDLIDSLIQLRNQVVVQFHLTTRKAQARREDLRPYIAVSRVYKIYVSRILGLRCSWGVGIHCDDNRKRCVCGAVSKLSGLQLANGWVDRFEMGADKTEVPAMGSRVDRDPCPWQRQCAQWSRKVQSVHILR